MNCGTRLCRRPYTYANVEPRVRINERSVREESGNSLNSRKCTFVHIHTYIIALEVYDSDVVHNFIL